MSEIPNQPPPFTQPPPYQPDDHNQQVPPGAYQQFPPPNSNPNFPPPPGGYQPYGSNYMGQINHPDAGSAQTCGIIGLVLFFNIIGIILNILAITKGSSVMKDFERFPGYYTESSFRKAKAGRTCGIIGLCLLGFGILVLIVGVAIASSL